MDFLKDYNEIISSAKKNLNEKHDFLNAYNEATQAKLIAEKYLKDEKEVIVSTYYQGMAYLGIDQMKRHDLLPKLICINKSDFSSTR